MDRVVLSKLFETPGMSVQRLEECIKYYRQISPKFAALRWLYFQSIWLFYVCIILLNNEIGLFW